MLPLGFIAHLIFNFVKKHTKSEHVAVNYFICTGICWTCFGVLGALLMLAYDSVFNQVSKAVVVRFLIIVPGVMFIIGEIYALVCWVLWLRKEI